jgi:magnesium chelatase subunit D
VSAAPDLASPWGRAARAAALFAIDPIGSGVALRAGPGPVRDAWLAALRDALAPGTPWRRAPLGISDDRLLGGLDLAATLRAGRPVAETGLLAGADGGVVALAMAERLSPGAAARIASAMDLGRVVAARDGLSLEAPARFGVVALDEGQGEDERLPAALLDRLTYWVDLTGVGAREIDALAIAPSEIAAARGRLGAVAVGDDAIEALVGVALELGVDSLRAPSLALRAARAACALRGGERLEEADISLAAVLVLAPRATRAPAAPEEDDASEGEPETAPEDGESSDADAEDENKEISAEDLENLILAAAKAAIPPDVLRLIETGLRRRTPSSRAGKAGASQASKSRGRPIGARAGAPREGRLALVDTLRAAAPWQKPRRREGDSSVRVRPEDFRVIRFRQRKGTTAIFAVDASGSSAMQRLAEVKGAIELLLVDCYVRRDSVALIAFRGKTAELILPPTRSLARAKRVLAGLPGGGGTPIASGLEAALALADRVRRHGETPLLVLMTDGRANVARDGGPGRARALEDALGAGRRVREAGIAALAIDTAPPNRRDAEAPTRRLAEAMRARYLKLPNADAAGVSNAVRAASTS